MYRHVMDVSKTLVPDRDIETWRVSSLKQKHGPSEQFILPSPTIHHIMNLALIDPFQLAQDSPESLTNDLSMFQKMTQAQRGRTNPSPGSGHATTLRFSRKGDYLASGRVDGKIVIW